MIAIYLPLYSSTAHAHCPLCTAAVGGGVAVTRFYGLDDIVMGIWVGAFVVSTALWMNKKIKRDYLPFQDLFISSIAMVVTALSFYFGGLLGDLRYMLFGVDKLLIGMVLGGTVTYLVPLLSEAIKKRRGRILFPFQTIILTLVSLLIISLLSWRLVS